MNTQDPNPSHHVTISGSNATSSRTVDDKSEHADKKLLHPGHRHRKMSEMSQGPGLMEMVAGDDPDNDDGLAIAAKSSSVIAFYPNWCKCFNCKRKEKNAGSRITLKHQFMDLFECPPRGTMGRIIVFFFLLFAIWGLFYYLFRPVPEMVRPKDGKWVLDKNHYNNPAWVKGPLFALMIVEVTGLLSGVLLKRFMNFPALLGPLVLGIIYNNVDALNVFDLMKGFEFRDCKKNSITIGMDLKFCEKMAKHTINNWVRPIRMIALGIILTRAGIELSPKQLKKLKGIVPMLAFGPCIVEACVCAACNYVFFHVMVDESKMSVAMCFVGGFALAAVSPAVVVPGALSLKRAGLGVGKGVPTLLIAASSIDDVLAISIYTIALGLAVTGGDLEKWQIYGGGFLGILIGLIHGMVMGILLHFVPPQKSKNKPQQRIILLLMLNIISVLAYEETWFNSAGSITVLTTSFIAGFGWRSQPHWKHPMHKIEGWLAHLWVLWVPLIFGTIGKEINFDGDSFKGVRLAKTFGVIFIALLFRCAAAYFLVSCGTGFNRKERVFIALSWIPKATVQAALAPLVLTRVTESPLTGKEADELQSNATTVVNVAILAVLLTAPIGCILMALTGRRLLEKFESPIDIIEEEFPNGEGFDPAESTYGFVPRVGVSSSEDLRGTSMDDVSIQVEDSSKLHK